MNQSLRSQQLRLVMLSVSTNAIEIYGSILITGIPACAFANGCFVIIASADDEPAAQKVDVDARDVESKLL